MTSLRTDRFLLAPLDEGDRDAFVAYRRDPAVARWQSWTPDFGVADADRLIEGQPTGFPPPAGEWLQLAVRDAGSGALLGDVAVHTVAGPPDTYEVGVTVAAEHQRRGVAGEALGAVVAALFDDHGAHRVIATSDQRNAAVARLLTGLGFRHEGRAVEADWFKGEWTTLDTWAMLARER
ncbi:RimJ/RimL family protein N-acetyltransferase [Microbacterium sp. AK009]|uniref:GNAT family N-acetyltransferase n=1 Tax=Microbacterium sp. AK009 TaxID=2723068 RepID=UPI0015CA7906|nr:GNAT family protein [Microbacterium sp. AK009]NYF15274.1 RimJ/RimL family protein N-acetyltransferase [Microbacterium sp. AK009]